nr:putative ribonuclease H-like domain-containing protein [Tanacetum cinerariifolium]
MVNSAVGNLSKEAKAFTVSLYSENVPSNVEQALKSKGWKDAMNVEMDALIRSETWDKCALPQGKKPVGCRWLFTVKYKPYELKEEVYMEAPSGFSENFKPGEVCRLKKSLYGLKQSPRAWFGRFTMVMKKYGFKHSNSDHTLFLKRRGNLITCLIIYVDDMIITGNDKEEIAKLRKSLFTEFEMKDLGKLKYFLGIEVLRSKRGIFMCQKNYILDLLAETGMVDCKPADTLMIMNRKLYMEEEAEPAEKKALRIIRYLKGTTGHGVLFQPNRHLETQLFTDADWAGNKSDQRSTSGYFTLVGGNLVTWRSKKQKVVALSSAEAEL